MAGPKTAAFALQKIHFSNGRFWRKAVIRPEPPSGLTAPPKPTVSMPMSASDRGCVKTMDRIDNEQFRYSIECHFESFVLLQIL